MATRGRIANFAGLDIGIEDINLPSGGKIEPRSSAGQSRLGARITFANLDETGFMLPSNGGIRLATTMKRNLSGMGGRWMETTNCYDHRSDQSAQLTHESKAPDVLIDYRPPRRTPDLADRETCLQELKIVYGDSWWVDYERTMRTHGHCCLSDPGRCVSVLLQPPARWPSAAVDGARWDAKAKRSHLSRATPSALGFDGSRSLDWHLLIASAFPMAWFHLKTWDQRSRERDPSKPRAMVSPGLKWLRFALASHLAPSTAADWPTCGRLKKNRYASPGVGQTAMSVASA